MTKRQPVELQVRDKKRRAHGFPEAGLGGAVGGNFDWKRQC